MQSSLPQLRENVSSTWVHALTTELEDFVITTHLRTRHSLFRFLRVLSQATVDSSCRISAILPSYLGWTFLGQHKGHSWCHERNTEIMGFCVYVQVFTTQEHVVSGWKLNREGLRTALKLWCHSSSPGKPGRILCMLSSCLWHQPRWDYRHDQMPGFLLRSRSHSSGHCWYLTDSPSL
jgi:hypothetical protein